MSSKAKPAKTRKSKGKEESIWKYRKIERQLFFWSVVAMTLGLLMFWGSRPKGRADIELINFLPLVIFSGSLTLFHGLMLGMKFRGDPVITGLAAVLSGMGILAQSRMGVFVSDQVVTMQHLMFPAGVALMFLMVLLFRQGSIPYARGLRGFLCADCAGVIGHPARGWPAVSRGSFRSRRGHAHRNAKNTGRPFSRRFLLVEFSTSARKCLPVCAAVQNAFSAAFLLGDFDSVVGAAARHRPRCDSFTGHVDHAVCGKSSSRLSLVCVGCMRGFWLHNIFDHGA